MNATTKRILVIVIALAIIIPTAYFAYTLYIRGSASQDPVSYVPYNSSFVAKYNSANGTTYAFMSNGSYGIVTTSSFGSFVPSVSNNATLPGFSNLSFNLSISEVYQGVQIFEISNISINESIFAIIGNSLGLNESLLALLPLIPAFSISNVSVYLANPATGVLTAGNLNGVKNAISAHESGQTFKAKRDIHFNSSSNISFYYIPLNTTSVLHISGNMTDNSTHIFVRTSNQTATQNMVLLLQLQNISGLNIRYYSNNLFEISFNVGYSGIFQLLSQFNLTGSGAGILNGVKL